MVLNLVPATYDNGINPDDVMAPCVNMNGTSFDELWYANVDAFNKVREAIDALRRAAPHGRDYYVKGVGAYNIAAGQYSARFNMLQQIENELCVIVACLSEQRPSR